MRKIYFIIFSITLCSCNNTVEPTIAGTEIIHTSNEKSVSEIGYDTFPFESNTTTECWSRNIYPLDSISNSYACSLFNEGVNSLLIAKYIGDNGAFPNETAFILSVESEKEYVKEYYTVGSLEVIELPKRELDWNITRSLFEEIKLDTVSTNPMLKMQMSHNIGFEVQYYSPNHFFCQRLQDNEWKSAIDKSHPKVLFWAHLTELLRPTTDR